MTARRLRQPFLAAMPPTAAAAATSRPSRRGGDTRHGQRPHDRVDHLALAAASRFAAVANIPGRAPSRSTWAATAALSSSTAFGASSGALIGRLAPDRARPVVVPTSGVRMLDISPLPTSPAADDLVEPGSRRRRISGPGRQPPPAFEVHRDEHRSWDRGSGSFSMISGRVDGDASRFATSPVENRCPLTRGSMGRWGGYTAKPRSTSRVDPIMRLILGDPRA